MSILIKGMEMPPSGTFNIIHIHCDGKVFMPEWGKGMQQVCGVEAVPVPPHGRLIDADEFEIKNFDFWHKYFNHPMYCDTLCDLITDAPTVIEAEE